jgi:DNA repair protein RadC
MASPQPLRIDDGGPIATSTAADLGRRVVPGCSDVELLGVLLGRRRSPLQVAGRLLDECGGLAGLSRADPVELRPMAGPLAAARIVAGIELGRRVAAAWPGQDWRVRTPADLAERLLPSMGDLPHEELRVALLSTKNAVLAVRTVYVGNPAGTSVRVGEVYRDAVRRQAAAIVVVHNHPSGDPSPSGEDLRLTAELAQAGRLLDIDLLDHLVLGHGRWVSLRAIGALGYPSPGTTTR